MSEPRRLKIMGAELDLVTHDEVMHTISSRAKLGLKTLIANHNLHSLYLFHSRQDVRDFYAKAHLIEIDSMPLIAWAKLLGYQATRNHRCTYLDFRDLFWDMVSQKGLRVFHLGGVPEAAPLAYQEILRRYPKVTLEVASGYFDLNGPENQAIIAKINQFKPDVLLVGMGMPRQETWVNANWADLPECAILNVGAAFDYEAGIVYTPPRWSGRLGLEWLARFIHDPKRLFTRYFLEPWALIPHALADLFVSRAAKQ